MVAGGNPSQWSVVYALGRYTVCSARRRSIIAPWEIYHPDLLPACLCMAVGSNLAVACVCGPLVLCLCQCLRNVCVFGYFVYLDSFYVEVIFN